MNPVAKLSHVFKHSKATSNVLAIDSPGLQENSFFTGLSNGQVVLWNAAKEKEDPYFLPLAKQSKSPTWLDCPPLSEMMCRNDH